ncbi:MarR family transcriptional regulator [Desulfovibrio mangrovi]|uniref:MarR family winged helix-turn-helix transcriptional regulator n=1 Tax=Desulfovibrio mangrovi TaxID=2976983 RepID=UPI002246E886|nr:MarR family transcriptional regulator [Desulfovibrio mangrovi]UZP66767.1 MarR family transcriptional regulator [Desulfovibrio mangrovi]
MDMIDRLQEQWAAERPDLDASFMGVCGRLMLVNKLLDQRAESFLKPYCLTQPEFDVLAVLRRFGEPYRLSAGELCEHALLSSGAMTNRIDRLESKGLVRREPNPQDRRGVFVSLTASGLALIDGLMPERLESLRDAVSVLSDDDRNQLDAILKRLVTALA